MPNKENRTIAELIAEINRDIKELMRRKQPIYDYDCPARQVYQLKVIKGKIYLLAVDPGLCLAEATEPSAAASLTQPLTQPLLKGPAKELAEEMEKELTRSLGLNNNNAY